jgi:IS5 family transposase
MEEVVPWARLVERLRPFYPKGRARPAAGWAGADAAALLFAAVVRAGRYDSEALRGFAGIDLPVAAVPDATTVLNFRHWLEAHDLTRALFDEVGGRSAAC